MPGRTSYTRARSSVAGAADEDESSLQMKFRYGYDVAQFLLGGLLAVWAGLRTKEHWGGDTWPIVRDSYLSPPNNGFGSGEVHNTTYNINWLLMVAGLIHLVMAFLTGFFRMKYQDVVSDKIPFFGSSLSRITDMFDTAGYHGITDALLGWAIYKHLGIAHTWLLYSLVAVHFLSFYIIGLLQTQAVDVLKPGDVIRHIFANMPAVLGLLVWEGYLLWQTWIWFNQGGSGNNDDNTAQATKALAPLYFFLSVSGIFGMGSNFTDRTLADWCCCDGCKKMFGLRFSFTRVVSFALRATIAIILLVNNCHPTTWVVHDQANYP